MEILINVRPHQTRVVCVEGRTLVDLKIEREAAPTIVGSIYKGKVIRVLPGMQAAFVDIGLNKAAFLYVGDIRTDNKQAPEIYIDENDTESHPHSSNTNPENLVGESGKPESSEANVFPPIQDLIKPGQYLLVQVAKDPLGTKGSRITTHVSLPGRNIVYMPTVDHVGISRRIESESERARLKEIVDRIRPQGGMIVRTAGEGAREEDIRADLEYLSLLWAEVQSQYEKRKGPGAIHSEIDVELRALRDFLSDEVDRVVVDDPKAFKKVLHFVTQFMPRFKNKIFLHRENRPLFDLYDLDLEIQQALGRRIWLKSGGYIVIDEAEALVVIDVNTGKFVGKRDLEDTIVTTNIEAAREIANQLRIRNCGGIIIIDFIDMEREGHREKVLSVLKEELAKDRAKTVVSNISEFGLVEMTRKRNRPSLISQLCEPCPYCEGKGYVKQHETIAHEIFRTIERDLLRRHNKGGTVVRCHSEVADWIYAEEAEVLEQLEGQLNHTIALKVEPHFHIEQYEIENL